MRVQVVFVGESFNRDAVIHTLRHLAMRVGWQLTLGANAERRIIYATTDDPGAIEARDADLVILSSRAVAQHLRDSREPIPLNEERLPFPHPHAAPHATRISADVIAGACAAMNLWYEERTRAHMRDGWIRWRNDWMTRAGWVKPAPIADSWLDEIVEEARRMGWGNVAPRCQNRFTIALTHDVDYLPTPDTRGTRRFVRALVRQIILRRRPGDALKLLARYARGGSFQAERVFDAAMRAEQARGARSSFGIVAARRHHFDPDYQIERAPIASALQRIAASEWEVCLHGSYTASRTPGALAGERAALERAVGVPVIGHRQHYLNFHPSQLFDEVEAAGLQYDSSVGYNDGSGARAGTYFPFRPFNLARGRAYAFWEIPFVLMDTTLATTYRFSPGEALAHSQAILSGVARAGGCAALIWHLEQLSGLLDPGYAEVYFELLDWIRAQGGAMVNARDLLSDFNARWHATMGDAE